MTLESLHCRVSYRIFSWGSQGCMQRAHARQYTRLGFADFNDILDIFKDKNRQIQL